MMDYKKKIGGFHSVFEPTSDVDKDIPYNLKFLLYILLELNLLNQN